MLVGLYFGSFNPIHNGHTALAEYILQHTDLQEIWLMVSPNNPLKVASGLLPEELRYELAQMASQNIQGIEVSDFEFSLPRPSYTIDSLHALSRTYPQHQFCLIMGSDNMAIFDQWKDYQLILNEYRIIVYPREGDDIESLKEKYPQMQVLHSAPLFEVSSTQIRELWKRGLDFRQFVHPAVYKRLIGLSN